MEKGRRPFFRRDTRVMQKSGLPDKIDRKTGLTDAERQEMALSSSFGRIPAAFQEWQLTNNRN